MVYPTPIQREYYVSLQGADSTEPHIGNLNIQVNTDLTSSDSEFFKLEMTCDDNSDYHYTKFIKASETLNLENIEAGTYSIQVTKYPETKPVFDPPATVEVKPSKTVTMTIDLEANPSQKQTDPAMENCISLTLLSNQGEDLSGYTFGLMRYTGENTPDNVYVYDNKTTDESGYVEWADLPDKDPKTGEKYYYEITSPDLKYDGKMIDLSLYKNNQVNISIDLDDILKKAASSISSMWGDADDNGEVGLSDVVAVAKYNVNHISFPLKNRLNADVNHDGEVDTLDLTMLIEYNLNGGKKK